MPESDYYREEQIWKKDVRAFVFAVTRHWLLLTGATISGGIATLFQTLKHQDDPMIPPWIFWAIATICFLIAAFLAFQDQLRLCEAKDGRLISVVEAHKEEVFKLKSELDERDKRRQCRSKLASYLSQLECRICEIDQMSPLQYMTSIDPTPNANVTTTYEEHVKYIKHLDDEASLVLLGEIRDYLNSIEDGKGALFLSISGIDISHGSATPHIAIHHANKQALMLDHLKHRAKNLKEIIKSFE